MLRLNRKVFFDGIRNGPFPGRLSKAQVDGINDLLDVWEQHGTDDPRHLAYALATSYHETGGRMQPVREGFKETDAAARAYVQKHYGKKGPKWYCWPSGPHGHVYYGRGDVQLTWEEGYAEMGGILGLPLVRNPDLALKGSVSKRILVEGMLRGVSSKGDFTGKALEDYFNATTDDPIGARRIVNGKDRAKLIAGYHEAFLEDIKAAMVTSSGKTKDTRGEDAAPSLPGIKDETTWGGLAQAVGSAAALLPSLAGFEKVPSSVYLIAAVAVVVGAVLVARGRRKLLRETGL